MLDWLWWQVFSTLQMIKTSQNLQWGSKWWFASLFFNLFKSEEAAVWEAINEAIRSETLVLNVACSGKNLQTLDSIIIGAGKRQLFSTWVTFNDPRWNDQKLSQSSSLTIMASTLAAYKLPSTHPCLRWQSRISNKCWPHSLTSEQRHELMRRQGLALECIDHSPDQSLISKDQIIA